MTSVHRVLVVEDYEPVRRIICDLLRERGDVLIVGEAANGADAIRQVEALRPDVVLLDVGLPVVSGLDVASRLRATVPDSKIIFVTIECSPEIVDEAFGNGAHGYVYKPRAVHDLLRVFDAVVDGARFVSGGLERIARGDSLATHQHHVVFCSSDEVIVPTYARFVAGVLNDGHAVIVAVSDDHELALRRSLQLSQVDLARAIRERRYIPINIGELFAKVMVNGYPDATRFRNAGRDLIADARRSVPDQGIKLSACGECAPTLWRQGHLDAALQLEHLWDELAKTRQLDTLCVYPPNARQPSVSAVRSLCAKHTSVEIR